MLEFRGVNTFYGELHVLKDVNYDIKQGEIVCLLGGNASGKSTTMKAVLGIVLPKTGDILFEGQIINKLPTAARVKLGIAPVPEARRLFPRMTVLENVMVAMHSRTTTGPLGAVLRTPRSRAEEKDAQERAVEIIEAFGNRLLPRTNQLVKELSYANRRRVEIARALASRPKVLLLDEPTAGMNPMETLELADQIRSLRGMGLTIFLIEHKLNVVNDLADKIIVLDHGEKIAEGTAEQVHSNPQVLEAYLGRKAAHA